MRGDRALGILGSAISPNSSAASVDQSKKKITVIESQLSGSLSPSQVYPTSFFALSYAFLFNGSGSLAWTTSLVTSASHPMGFDVYHLVAEVADSDEYTMSMPLAAGDYILELLYVMGVGSGKFDAYFDGVAISTGTDCYAASTTYNNMYSQAFTCSSDGNHTVMFKINGKHASSSDYQLRSTYVMIRPA